MKYKNIFILIVICTLHLTGYTQVNLNGKIIDNVTKKPIPFVNVVVKSMGTTTNKNGTYKFKVKSVSENDSVLISCLGYCKKTICF